MKLLCLEETREGLLFSERRLRGTGELTRRSIHGGDMFLSGVDRRVGAPLGTLTNFSRVLVAPKVSSRIHTRYGSIVELGSSLLLRLMGSMISISYLSITGVEFSIIPRRIITLYQGIIRVLEGVGRASTRVVFRARLSTLRVRASPYELRRMLVGLLIGTAGFAGRKCVALALQVGRIKMPRFVMASAKYKVPLRGRRTMFNQFRGLGRNVRNAKLKLSVYGLVVGHVKKSVQISSACDGKTHFVFARPLGRRRGQ